jgi:DNA-binding NarL/FixJ family response regulator
MIRIIIADDQVLFNDLLGHMLESADDIHIVAHAYNGREVLELARSLKPDIILMDLSMPILNGIETLKAVKQEGIQSKVLILTSSEESDDVKEAIQLGANGYVLKSVSKERLILAIRSIYAGMDVYDKGISALGQKAQNRIVRGEQGVRLTLDDLVVDLSDREMNIIEMIIEGKTAEEMAQRLYIAEGRVRNIITDIIGKLMVKDRTQLAVFAIKHKLINIK